MKVFSMILASVLASGALFAADFSKSSNADLLNMAGKVKADEARDFFVEVDKRIDEMTTKQAREFWEKFRKNEEKVFDGMKVKDVRAYKQSLMDARGGMPMPQGKKDKHHKKHGHFGDCACDGKAMNPPPKAMK